MKLQGITHVTFITQERLCLSWRASPGSHYTVNSLSSMSATAPFYCTACMDGGCHVILQRWRIGGERLSVACAHAEWTGHAKTPVIVVTVMWTTVMYCVKTAVCLWARPFFQLNSLGLGILVMATRDTTPLGDWSVMEQYKRLRWLIFLKTFNSVKAVLLEILLQNFHWKYK